MYAAWGVIAALLVGDAAVITLIGLDKIHVKEKERSESEEEY